MNDRSRLQSTESYLVAEEIAQLEKWMSVYQRIEDGLMLNVHAQPGASMNALIGVLDGRLKIKVKGKAVDGAANRALCEFLASFFIVSKSAITLIAGEKRVHVYGNADLLIRKLEAELSVDRDF